MVRRVVTSTRVSSPSWAGCSTSAMRRLAMNRPVRTGVPPRVTSVTSTMPRAVVTSIRRPFFEATISNVWTPWPVSTTASTRSPLIRGRPVRSSDAWPANLARQERRGEERQPDRDQADLDVEPDGVEDEADDRDDQQDRAEAPCAHGPMQPPWA